MKSYKKNSIKNYLKKSNVKRFSLFIIIAFVFLIFSKLSNDYKQIINLKVNLANLENEIIVKEDSLGTINAFIEAKGLSLIPFIFNNSKTITLDINTDVSSKKGHFIFDVQKHKFLIEGQLGKSYKLLSLKPDTLIFNYSELASKMVPLELKHKIEYATGYDIKDKFNLSADSVKIVGSSTEVDSIYSLSTDVLELKDVNSNIKEGVKINILEYKDIDVFPKSIIVSADVARFTEGTIDVPVSITNKPNKLSINYFPKTVRVSYYVDLDNYSAIKASDFIVECNYEDLEGEQTYFVPKIVKKPKFIKRVSLKQKRIDFIKL